MTMARSGNGILALLASVLAISGLVFIDVAPHIADYIALAAGAVGLVIAIVQRDAILRDKAWWALLGALALLALTLPFVYRSSQDLVPILALLPFLAVAGIAYLVAQSEPLLQPFALPMLCLIGAVTAALVGLSEYIASAGSRVGAGNNPIHYGGIAVLLGFMALTGLCVGRSAWRLVFLLGPLAGMAAAIMSGSRGPMLAGMAMAVASMPMLVYWYRREWALLVAIVIMVLGVPALTLISGSSLRALKAFSDLTQATVGAMNSGAAADAAAPALDSIRVAMYKSALQQFLDSPIYGQGFGQILNLARAAHPEYRALETLDHLHSDIADFAALGGMLGLLAYGLIIVAPLLNLHLREHTPNARMVALGSALLATGYLTLGLTNAMFGVLPQTVLFVVLLGYLIALRRRADGVSMPPR